VLLAVPFSAIGALFFLWMLDYNVSAAVWVGLIALLGLDAETGVFMLLSSTSPGTSRRARAGCAPSRTCEEAIVHGAVKRVRPSS
jgi:Cu(I)/Ag(I) efflux system membrane protein CusA/SilA